ncbi:RNA polymerase sigma factor [Winogradskya humida]|uniref:RNA polymerase sigma24 factor n=1 Tax=Winogradskya humida TaxID=113566 RepID=A0ABQ3ZK14_9ACTN|nr:SigE family RNA polymerase sigma factor [Actinoplanes humidus]GIE18898.1 RNA polymerase sigma24 factor [Actinoplanes humidus]
MRPEPGPAVRLRAVAGGRGEFDAFYLAWYGRITAQVYAYLGDRGDAEDVTQEAFVRAWQRWGDVSAYEDPVSWVRRVAWNLATSRLRRMTTAAKVMRRQPPPGVVPGMNPDHVLLVAALRKLPERQRRVIVMHHIADVPVADIAHELGVPTGTVAAWLHRGRARLAEDLGPRWEVPS